MRYLCLTLLFINLIACNNKQSEIKKEYIEYAKSKCELLKHEKEYDALNRIVKNKHEDTGKRMDASNEALEVTKKMKVIDDKAKEMLTNIKIKYKDYEVDFRTVESEVGKKTCDDLYIFK